MTASNATIFTGPTGTLPVVNSNGQIYEEVQVATLNQVLFTLLTFTYTTGTKTINVFKNGVRLRRGTNYTETSSTQVTLTTPCAAGDVITFAAFAISQVLAPLQNNGVIAAGNSGQVLAKNSNSDYDLKWLDISSIATLLDQPVQIVASAPTVDVTPYSGTTRNLLITGATQIDGWAITAGQVFLVRFAAALTLSNNISQVTGTGAAVRVSPNDSCIVRATATNTVEILLYTTVGGNVNLGSINGTAVGGFKNRLFNGNFQLNQRGAAGAVVLAAGAYGHDRWKAGAAGCSYTFALSGLDTVITITAGSLIQVVEDKNVEGGVYTLSNRGTAQARIGVNGAAPAGAYASATALNSATATGFQTMSVEFTVGTLDRVQLESGSFASVYERRSYGTELALCQRYYTILPLEFVTYQSGGVTFRQTVTLPVAMRVAPTITFPLGLNYTNASAGSAFSINTQTFLFGATATALGTVDVLGTAFCSAEL
jgi:hypothetical protein